MFPSLLDINTTNTPFPFPLSERADQPTNMDSYTDFDSDHRRADPSSSDDGEINVSESSRFDPTTTALAYPPQGSATWQGMVSILRNGPTRYSEWWTYELMSFLFTPTRANTMLFDGAALWCGFLMLRNRFRTTTSVFLDTLYLIPKLPIGDRTRIEKRLLVDLIVAAARESRLSWWWKPRERMAVLFGVLLGSLVLRCVGQDGNGTDGMSDELRKKVDSALLSVDEDEGLAHLLGKAKFDLGVLDDEEVMGRLSDALEAGLNIAM
ncbi:hypothetical protein K504DRAFT_496999 [Pleomassaria siparia CBS 279.74]|uniref:Uncharacterized protein n=1 Tax=Pleomassaria siparia CBS 279.74 TaxID=1314801 RepID=A0A6G1KQE8_9PLEO|nr:hypothetical protein K504DRAFT_496999 [Pleomassaria siparia CBS 279.74]